MAESVAYTQPLNRQGGRVAAVLDIDSPKMDRFGAEGVPYREAAAAVFSELQFSRAWVV